MDNYYCTQENCAGLLLECPVVKLTYPSDHMYQCLSCNHRYLRHDNEDKLRDDYYQERDLKFGDFYIKEIKWDLKCMMDKDKTG